MNFEKDLEGYSSRELIYDPIYNILTQEVSYDTKWKSRDFIEWNVWISVENIVKSMVLNRVEKYEF